MDSTPTPTLCPDCATWKPRPLPDRPQVNRVHDILRSNTHPLDTSHFRSAISYAAPELARYDSEIERLENGLARMVAARAALQSYIDTCRSIFAPVRRLPVELLVEIFAMSFTSNAEELTENDTPAGEMDRISKKYLLQLSQVCSHWHVVVMSTARLWSTISLDATLWPACPTTTANLLGRLTTSLARGGNHPLTLEIGLDNGSDPNESLVMEALAQHSWRWRNVYLWIDLESLKCLSNAKGNLPLLDYLCITGVGQPGTAADVFATAPRLKSVIFEGEVIHMPHFPWEQLEHFRYITDGLQSGLHAPLALMTRMHHDRAPKFTLSVHVEDIDISIEVPPLVADVHHFSLELLGMQSRFLAPQLLGIIFKALTLPRLHVITIDRDWESPAPVWDNTHFLPFAARSSLHDNLAELEVHFEMSDAELLECLAVLPMLTSLIISDCGGTEHHAVVTDNLLRRLTRTDDPNTYLVPRLNFFSVTSILTYTDDVYWSFLASRVLRDGWPVEWFLGFLGKPFQACIWWLARVPREREISGEFLSRVASLVGANIVGFQAGQDPAEPPLVETSLDPDSP
ncbi:hypothetical protein B0H15DRAFT_819629 [Mycena belliarum]|uniref:F-box domain-containing protein n=1 Tax=Mycena belliarum TaxID=1033014 RepID=A0AAD6UHE2_9AGAR|nr:hypothetical protein B0H15DRAFT_819629 [Mycena belliae]